MKLTKLRQFVLLVASLSILGCNDSGSSSQQPAPPSPQSSGPSAPQYPAFRFVSDSIAANSTNIAVDNFSVTFTFTNNLNVVSAVLDLNASAADTTVKLTSASGNEPISVSVSGASLTVTLKNAGSSLLPSTLYSLTIAPGLTDINGQTLSSTTVLSFTTAAGAYPGYLDLLISEENPDALATQGVAVGGFSVSVGSQSQLYDIVDSQMISGLQTTPVVPVGAFALTQFSYRFFYPLAEKTTYYLAARACNSNATSSADCSVYSPELQFTTQ